MLTKQLRELERQAESIDQGKLNELHCVDGLYYVGNLVDVDGNGWVSEDEVYQIFKELK